MLVISDVIKKRLQASKEVNITDLFERGACDTNGNVVDGNDDYKVNLLYDKGRADGFAAAFPSYVYIGEHVHETQKAFGFKSRKRPIIIEGRKYKFTAFNDVLHILAKFGILAISRAVALKMQSLFYIAHLLTTDDVKRLRVKSYHQCTNVEGASALAKLVKKALLSDDVTMPTRKDEAFITYLDNLEVRVNDDEIRKAEKVQANKERESLTLNISGNQSVTLSFPSTISLDALSRMVSKGLRELVKAEKMRQATTEQKASEAADTVKTINEKERKAREAREAREAAKAAK